MECAQPSHGAGERKPAGSGIPKLRKSCDPCSLAKRRCDGQPQCSLCVKKGIHCIYGERQKSGPKGRKGLAAASTQRQQLLLQQQQHQQQQQHLNQGQRYGSAQPPGRRRGPFVPAQPTRTGDIVGDTPPPPSQTRPQPHPATDKRSPLDATTSSARHILDSGSDGSIDDKDHDVRTMVTRAPPPPLPRGGTSMGVSSGAEHRHGHSGGGVGDSSSTEPMQLSWVARDGGLPHYGPPKINGGGRGMRGNDGALHGRNNHANNDKQNGGGSFGALMQPNPGEDNHRLREFPNKFRRTAEEGWPSRARQDSAVDREPSRSQLQESIKVQVDTMVRPYSGPDSSDGPAQYPGGRRPDPVDSPPHRRQQQQQQQWSTGQRRPVSPSHVSRSDVQSHGAPPAVATNCQGVEPHQNGPGAEDDQSWRSAVAAWPTRRPPSAGGVASTEMRREGNGRVTPSMAYSARSGSNGGSEERGRGPGSRVGYPLASTPPADLGLTTDAARGDGRRADMTTVALPNKESVAVRSPPTRVASRIEERTPNTDHQHRLQEQQQQQQNQVGSSGRYQVSGRPVYEGGGGGATAAASTPAAACTSTGEVSGAWQYGERAGVVVPRGSVRSVPGRWNEYEYWQPERGIYQRWDPRFEVERRGEVREHYEIPPVTKKHLLPWPIGKIEAMETMGASRADDEATWKRIAAAVGSSVSEAMDQWEAYCETMRREHWTASVIRGVMTARDRMWVNSVSVAGGPTHWAGGQHHPWPYRADAAAVAAAAAAYPVPVRGGPKADVYAPTATSFGGGSPHPPATFGRCSCCFKLWQTNSPTDAAALQSGSWVCPACQAGARSGPVPPFWEDDNGYIAIPREDITRAHPPPQVHVHRPPYFSPDATAVSANHPLRRPSWHQGRLPPSNGDRGSGLPVPVGWGDEGDTEPVGASRPTTSTVADRNNGLLLPSAITPQEKGEGDKNLPTPERLLARPVTASSDAETPRGRRARGGEGAGASGDIAGGGNAADGPSLDPPAVMLKLSNTKAAAVLTSGTGTASATDAASCGGGEQQGVEKSSTSPTPAEANKTALSRKQSLAPPTSSQPYPNGSMTTPAGGVVGDVSSADPPASAPPHSGIEAVAVTAAAEVLRSLPHEKKDMGDVGDGDDRMEEDAMEVEISRGEVDAVKRGKDGSIRGGEVGGTGSPCDRGAGWVGGVKTHRTLFTTEAVEAIVENIMTNRSTERTDTLEETGYTTETCPLNATWSKEDDKRLLQVVGASPGEPDDSPREVDWEVVAIKLHGRTPEQCRIRWSNLRSVRWTNEEDQPSQDGHKNETAVATGGECVDPTTNPWGSTRYSRTDGERIRLSQASVDCEGRGRGYDRPKREGGERSARSIEEDNHGHRENGRNQQDRRRRSPSNERGYALPGQRMLGTPYSWHQGTGKPGDRRRTDAAAVDSPVSERLRAPTAAPRANHGGGGGGVHEDVRQLPRNPDTAREREDYEAGQQSRRPRNTQHEGADVGGSDPKPAWTHLLPPVYAGDRGWGGGSAQKAGALQRRVEGGFGADEQQQQQQRAMWSGRGIDTKPETGVSREKLLGVQEEDIKRTSPVEDRVRGPHRGDAPYGWYRGGVIAELGSNGAGFPRYTEEQARERINQMQEEEERRLAAIEREHKRERERASGYERRSHGGDAPGEREGRSGEMKVESHKAPRGGVPGRRAGGGEGGGVDGFTPPASGRRGRVEGGTSHHRRESPKGQLMSRVMMEGERKMDEVRRSSLLDGSENRVGWRFSDNGGGKTLQAKEEQPRGADAGNVGGGGGSTAAAMASVDRRKKAIDHLRPEGWNLTKVPGTPTPAPSKHDQTERHRGPRACVRDNGGKDGAGSGGGDGSIDRKEVRAGTAAAPPQTTDAAAALSPGSRGARAKHHSRGL